ncbi:Oidioi.mRNA.OKI2018_I69.chr1.g3942.t1.cds [Oikopleura dioica]|uniref:Oidioi.mRNA.OKI2018_I69.chr1.g3942.t1.cds n=1 Tax=Oikopleura dioica TaxID=34765 RepID=A0ABN7T278_OIKDI|nr:Oidioi.mRNA.OKI2018_I69.chr1.g3942.t1.cds [Oikopleura dioica]
MLQSGHADYCEFANSHEPFEFLKKNDSPYLFKKRLQPFPGTLDFLPKVTSGISEEDLDFLSRYFSYCVKNKKLQREIINLAVNGWSFHHEDETDYLLCEDDVRQIPER